MRAATIREWLEHDDLNPVQRFMLELRLEAAKSSGSKYRRGLEVVGEQDRIRYAIQFSGAGRTGRSSGRGFQPHNMQRPVTSIVAPDGSRQQVPVKSNYILEVIVPGIKAGVVLENPLIYGGANEACANALRCCIIAAPGNELIVGDWANIEGRILAWIAAESWKLDAYRAADRGESADGYKLLYSRFFGTPVEQVDDNQRQVGKVVDLSCGYLASVGALVTMALTYQIDLDTLPGLVLPSAKQEHRVKAYRAWRKAFIGGDDYGLEPATFEACHVLVQVYREANDKIISTGRAVGKACIAALKEPNVVHEIARCKIWNNGNWLIIQLPSGRRLLYSKPKLHTERIRDPESGKDNFYEYVSYLATRGRSWVRERAWAGLFIENIVQAIANDILRAALLLVHRKLRPTLPAGVETPIVLHVHDEIACELPIGMLPLKDLLRMMTKDLLAEHDWMRDLPLEAKGWVGPAYHK
jgi:DNA polymerase